MSTMLPRVIEDLTQIYLDDTLLDVQKAANLQGKFHIIANWHSPTHNNSFGMLVYDSYILAWTKEGKDIYGTLQFDELEPKGAIDLWSAKVLLRKRLHEFNVVEFVERIRKHRLTGM